MKTYSVEELYKLLCDVDESVWIESKGEEDDTNKSLMESVCSFSNEPGLGGGYILYGISENKGLIGSERFIVEGVKDSDKAQLDISTQCASMFNIPVRPKIDVELLQGKRILKIFVPELPSKQKPLYFKNKGLPQGAWRRIGSSDQRCTENDLYTFYQDNTSFDSSEVKDTSFEDVDLKAVEYYRKLRTKVNPKAEELNLDNYELLRSLECITKDGNLTFAGLLLFGTKQVLRRTYPLMRTDYIRVRGNEWVENVDERFSSIEFMGPLMLQVDRMIDAVLSDLPQNFSLKEGQIYATTKPDLPERVLREAIVNALMHRSYRHNRPTQIIRYNNRIEIINSGYSLKAQNEIGTAGSDTRNQLIASIFHETNLAEFKGTGIRTMRRLMREADLTMPTFESNFRNDTFTIRLLVHKFFNEEDIKWLSLFSADKLSHNQSIALIFAREVGAVDTLTYSQLTGEKYEFADKELKYLEELDLLTCKGKTLESTYYVLSKNKFIESNAKGNNKTYFIDYDVENVKDNLEVWNKTEKDNCGEKAKTVEKNCGENTKTVEKILSAIKNNSKITQIQLSELTGLSRRGIEWQLSQMKEKGLISRIGPDKGGYWEVLHNNKNNKLNTPL